MRVCLKINVLAILQCAVNRYNVEYSPRTTVGISINLALAASAGQDLDAINPSARPQVETENRLAHACVERKDATASLATALSKKLAAAVFVAELNTVETGAVVDLDL